MCSLSIPRSLQAYNFMVSQHASSGVLMFLKVWLLVKWLEESCHTVVSACDVQADVLQKKVGDVV